MYGRTLNDINRLDGVTVSISDAALITKGQSLPTGTVCGTINDPREEVTKNFIYPLECPANAKGRYVQLQRNQETVTVMEVEVYIPTIGKVI